MSIPKIIHYCWFGGAPLPENAHRCMESWKTFCPDYVIREWNESNFDVFQNRYAKEAYAAKKWAFVSDYARLKVLADYGGIYLDVDVELLRPFDDLLSLNGFLGFQSRSEVNSGLGFGAEPHHPVIEAMLHCYDNLPFLLPDGSFDLLPCPQRNTRALEALGLRPNGTKQSLDGFVVFPPEVFCPMHHITGKLHVTPETYSIHHFHGSWKPEPPAFERRLKRLLGKRLYYSVYGRFKGYYGRIKTLLTRRT